MARLAGGTGDFGIAGALGVVARAAAYGSAAAGYWALREGRLRPDRIRAALIWASLLESAVVLLQFGGLDPLRLAGWEPEAFSSARMRVYGTFGNPAFAAAWTCAVLPLFLEKVRQPTARLRWAVALAIQFGATLHHSVYENARHFAISQSDPKEISGAEDMTELMKKMMDPNLSDTQREQVMAKLQKAQEQMQAAITKMTDPANLQAAQVRRDQFGCEIELEAQTGSLKGSMRCADAVGNRIAVTGAVKFLGR